MNSPSDDVAFLKEDKQHTISLTYSDENSLDQFDCEESKQTTSSCQNKSRPGFVPSSHIYNKRPFDEDSQGYKPEIPTLGAKRRRIHMTASDCFSFAGTAEGSSSLTNPMSVTKGKQKQLLPVHRGKRSKEEKQTRVSDNSERHGLRSVYLENVFTKASEMYDITKKSLSTIGYTEIKQARKRKSDPLTGGQKSILDFVTKSPLKSQSLCPQSTSNQSSHENSYPIPQSTSNQSSHENSSPSKMFSPIKKLPNSESIFISDSPSSSPSSGHQHISHKSSIRDNPVVKQLFDAQKSLNMGSNRKKGSSSKIKIENNRVHTSPAFAKETMQRKLDKDCSFDMNAMFDSDMDDTSDLKCSDMYGLLGTGHVAIDEENDKPKVNYFECLPLDVIENILCQLPMMDLCLNSNRVCLGWNQIISDSKFVPWKKLYHKLKKGIGNSKQEIQELMQKNGMVGPSTYLASLIRFMMTFKPVTAHNMLQCLQKHNKYEWAVALMGERLRDCFTHEEPNPWSLIATLVAISHSVQDIQEIIQCLSCSASQCRSVEVVECLYCIATFLYAFKVVKTSDVWNGMHYRLFYALYLFENVSSSSYRDLQQSLSSCGGQQSIVKYGRSSDGIRLTHEQMRIVKHKTEPKEIIKIVAFAGTGKTTTLVRYTQHRPDKKFLLVVYNKSVCDYAKTKFPVNVTCKTGHALAYGDVGRRYTAAKKLWEPKISTLIEHMPKRKGDNLFIRAKFVLDTLHQFMASADPFITTAHVPTRRIDDKTGNLVEVDHQAKMRYLDDAEEIWEKMKDLQNKQVGMSHDGYLKLYQLSKPKLHHYDCILIDEAQDLTPAITDILLSQPQGKILVGDPHQQIYSFRGAVNAMEKVQADTIFYLTQSFRFGPEIAHVAACCLEICKQVKQKTLVGHGIPGTVLGEQIGQLAIITRCNFTLFNEAVKKCCYADTDWKVAFVGGTRGFGFPMLQDLYTLLLPPEQRQKENRCISNSFIKSFQSFAALEQFANKTFDNELLGKIKIVKTYHMNFPRVASKILSKTVDDLTQADIIFSTAHKAKGLEFSTVRLGDDFSLGQHAAAINIDGMVQLPLMVTLRDPNSDESNLLYVAVTRAKHALQMTPTLVKVLALAGERFDFPVLSKKLEKDGTIFKCRETDANFKPTALTLQRKEIIMGDLTKMESGVFSPELLSEDGGSFSELLGVLQTHVQEKKEECTHTV
ncbi:hypothetical protein ACJMK2_015575 [Sinanodonta woodiana]|uniref:F-box domain-containing protein n=1 Tax=Sinanodonta woodiana TaxID=1069815 RepID=A0ABD3UUC6_SINWO